MSELEKNYRPDRTEEKWYGFWMEKGFFHAPIDGSKKPYTIMMPPPNVTGILHMGHALQSTIQDLLIRYHRMRGHSALWMPGMDHAGIATQNVVEKKLRNEDTSREELGRDKFIEEVWKWKEKHGNIISSQQQKLGSSCDWKRERFTMDEGLSKAVKKVFVSLYEKDMIYRGKYIVNWCPHHQTALSDEEAPFKECNSNLWFIKYPLEENSNKSIIVATTRPETMLGDTAVAVNPKDKRYKDLIGKHAVLPILGRKLKIIADDHIDKKFGTGAVKVTPAHDPNDFIIGNRHDLERVAVIDERGNMTEEAGELFQGMERFECRKKLVDELEKQGYIEKIEDYEHSVRHCYRCSSVIEPILSDQWFLKMKPLAEKAVDVVRKRKITFFPEKWEKDYLFWMENIRDWCISRQLWWGHRIPVWYCNECGEVIASMEEPSECTNCSSGNLRQDEDVLDTWFSSWLWPFSTLDWPDETPELKYFYPTDVLVSGYDILFFWIARMIMAGLWFMEEIPYSKVYITPMIKDEEGRIMSKSLGNSINPIEMIEKYGADSVRFSLVSLTTEGQDIKLSPFKFELGRNFSNKIWNAFRFLKMKESELQEQFGDEEAVKGKEDLSDRWIISRLHSTWKKCDDSLKNYKLNEALNAIYEFLWHDYCDWYVELIKNRLYDEPEEGRYALERTAMPVFKKTMELLHPFMPFITEEIWQNIPPVTGDSIMITMPGEPDEKLIDTKSEKEIDLIQKIVYSVRNIRGEMNVPPSKKANLIIKCTDKQKLKIITAHETYFRTLAGISEFKAAENIEKPGQSASAVLSGMEIFIPLVGLIDIDNERSRLGKEIDRLEKHIGGLSRKLSNRDFLEKAKKEIVEKERMKLDTFSTNLEKLKDNLNSLEE